MKSKNGVRTNAFPFAHRNLRFLIQGFLIQSCVFLLLSSSAIIADESRPNVLLVCVDDLRPELRCFGAEYIHSPNIDRLASQGRRFARHYVQSPTCGASRYALLTGTYGGSSNNALFERAKSLLENPGRISPSMPAWFRQNGYTTVSVGKVSHHPGGRGGDRWDKSSVLELPDSWDRHLLTPGPWQDPRGWMHGLANGEIRNDETREDGTISMHVMQSTEGPDSIYPDGVSIDEALRQMDLVTAEKEKPFFLAVGILRPHLPFGAPAKYLQHYADTEMPPTAHPQKPKGKTTWHKSGEFYKYDRGGRDPNTDAEYAIEVRKHYAACVSYADAQVGKLMDRLRTTGADKNTIVVLWGDHGWHLGEHAIWGKHALFEESLHSPLIISYPEIAQGGEPTNAMVETLDIFPTLCELTGLPTPDFVDGVSLKPILDDPKSAGHPAFSYFRSAKTIRTETHRLIRHKNGHVELYDHGSAAKETENIASENSLLVETLSNQLDARLD
ncbi:Choline-sulfatase [Novipirellula galeiformis]|uniref:Choline-sulfatase n=1 Tax=Novipirellula galeiformis TaxID=2528004 RepID=A0A5C6CQC4_9BACT|nr:Choline-sulfatase [Novipirellula galeiformis]